MAAKAAHAYKLQEFVASSSKKASGSSDPWRPIETAMRAQREIFLPLTYLERRGGVRGTLAGIARDLLRVTAETPKPNGDRLREYRDSALLHWNNGCSDRPSIRLESTFSPSLAECATNSSGQPTASGSSAARS